ncbi:molybdopterin-dependent oxidoreductase [Pedosphaera parvula]|uniref:Molybdopterin oxidoreductase Fe4S4 region n=1 Tax=Pedosphaera parvula (strain Ellin514) TaxID=320771 RepID=B9XHI1_PEDPL|nr:molybdopterin-dependent oxidoreductase [Pedosphaera parvula]EEF60816.1 molybdopterin oxidoreductase Fe4S4 region [Pedosphaera parvula Ellin514]
MSTVATTENKPAQPAIETIKIKVDGKEISVPKTVPDPMTGKQVPTTMIQACSMATVDVPHYCYHPKLPVAGNCRMCLVEFGTPAMGPDRKPVMNPDGTPKIAKSPRPAIACATPISPGMEIYTTTPAVKQMREGVLEFLLINHPLDCPICDQAGECKLQEYSVDYGQATSRFVEPKVHKPKRVDLGPRIMLDDERCILCTRCIRFSRDIVGDDALGIVNRGSYNTLSAYPGKSFDNNYTLNTVDICPVGALTSKDFRFKMRVWFLKETKSVCTSCATGCNIIIGSREEKVYRYEPRENDAVNSTWMCDSGRLNYKWINRDDRLTEVKIGLAQTTWSNVLKQIGEKLAKAQPGSVAIVGSARQTNEELYLLSKIAKKFNAITDSVPRTGPGDKILLSTDLNPNSNGAKLTGISPAEMGSNLPKIADGIRKGSIKTLIVFGEDVTKVGIGEDLLGKLENLIVSDILPNKTTEKANFLLPGCAHAEKRGSFVNGKGRVQKFMQAIVPRGEARPEWEFLHELVHNVTGKNGYSSIEGLFNQMAQEIPAFNGVTWASLGDKGVTIQI